MRAPSSELIGLEGGEIDAAELARLASVSERLGRPIRVLAPCGAGLGVWALAEQAWIAEVLAADARPWALHLLALRLAAFDALGPEAPAFFLGEPAWRAAWDALRPQLRPDARLWWDARPAQLAYGLDRIAGALWTPQVACSAKLTMVAQDLAWVATYAPQTWDVVVGDVGVGRRIGGRPSALIPGDSPTLSG